jgi:hypothetical protein
MPAYSLIYLCEAFLEAAWFFFNLPFNVWEDVKYQLSGDDQEEEQKDEDQGEQ